MFLAAQMFDSWSSDLFSQLPNRHFHGKCSRISIYPFGRFGSFLALILVLGLSCSGFCSDSSVTSASLGFEISGFDRSKNWVSENRVFEFGFFENDNGDFVVGIRYKLAGNSANLPVWTVGGGIRVSLNSTFKLSVDGKLILFENPSGLVIWSSNTSDLGVQKASLLNNGDFVLMNNDDKILWESFNSPTNTLLPGQSLRYPQILRAPSRKAISSYYNLVIRKSGELDLVWEENVTYWKSHLSSTVFSRVKEARFDENGTLKLLNDDTDDAKSVIWSVTSKDFGDPLINLRHLRIDQDGNLRIYSWDSSVNSWRVGWQAVEDQCNVFGFCGSYSFCGYNSTSPICTCLYSDPSETDPDPGGSLCKKMVDLDNCKMRTSMLTMKQTFLYGLYPPHDSDIMLSEESCKNYCSKDSSCIAVTSKNDGSGLCTIKRTTFISGLSTPYIPSTSFLKVCFVPQAASARVSNPNDNAGPVSLLPGRIKGEDGKTFIEAVCVIAFVTVSLLLTVETLGFWFIHRRKKMEDKARNKVDKMNPRYSAIVRLSFQEIQELTNNFEIQLGSSVFKGLLPNKIPVVAKLINNPAAPAAMVGEKEFRLAVSILGGTHHRNLVALKGFCFDKKQCVLLYEYVQNGSLDDWLLKNKGKNWRKRVDVTLGIVRAIAYLHTECQNCITHGNLKLENVLLDENLVPKITDYGIRSFLEKESTSRSFLGSPSEKDIYMLGEMLLQIVLCRRDVVVDSVDNVISEFNDQDQDCLDNDDLDSVERTVRIAFWCMQSKPFLRPSIGEVVKVLQGTLSVDRPPSVLATRNREKTTEIEEES